MAALASAACDAASCESCQRPESFLRAVSGMLLCESCADLSARIDQQLVNVASNDPVACDDCSVRVDFDARLAVITRGCGGSVLCDQCVAIEDGRARA